MSNSQDQELGPWTIRFMKETITTYSGNTIDLPNSFSGYSNLYQLSLAILADHENQENNSRGNVIKKGYNEVPIKNKKGKNTTYSILKNAEEIVNLVDKYNNTDFIENVLFINYNWNGTDENADFYCISKNEVRIPLCKASMITLVKAWRFRLMMIVTHQWSVDVPRSEWHIENKTTYKVRSRTGSFVDRVHKDFPDFLIKLVSLYDKTFLLTPELSEYINVLTFAISVGKKEYAEQMTKKREEEKLKRLAENKLKRDSEPEPSQQLPVKVVIKRIPKPLPPVPINAWVSGNPVTGPKKEIQEEKIEEISKEKYDDSVMYFDESKKEFQQVYNRQHGRGRGRGRGNYRGRGSYNNSGIGQGRGRGNYRSGETSRPKYDNYDNYDNKDNKDNKEVNTNNNLDY